MMVNKVCPIMSASGHLTKCGGATCAVFRGDVGECGLIRWDPFSDRFEHKFFDALDNLRGAVLGER